MTNPSPWNLQAPVARSAFLQPAGRGKRKKEGGSRRKPVLAGRRPAAEMARSILLFSPPPEFSISSELCDLGQLLPSSRFGGLVFPEGTCSPTEGGAKMTSASPWNPQAPVARSAFPQPTQRGKGEARSGSRRTPVPAEAAIAAPTPCPGGHAARRDTNTARSTGTPRAFAERSQGRRSRNCTDHRYIFTRRPTHLSPLNCVVYVPARSTCRFGGLALLEATCFPKQGGAEMPNPSPQKRPAQAGKELS